MRFVRTRRVIAALFVLLVGAGLGVVGTVAWRERWFVDGGWTAVLAIAILVNSLVALTPVWREERRRRRQAALLRFRLWIHFSKLRWMLAHMKELEPTRSFLTPGCGGEELYGIEVLLAQAHLLEIDEYEWVIFTVNAALPFFGRPVADLDSHATRLLWTVDATLARLNRPSAQGEAEPHGRGRARQPPAGGNFRA